MLWTRFVIIASLAIGAVGVSSVHVAHSATIMKLDLGADADDDIQLSGGQFSTIDEGSVGALGHQHTAVEFTDFLDSFADIPAATASFTLAGLTPTGDSTTFSGWLVEQDFEFGSLSLYAADNTLLLSADLQFSAVTGPLGAPGMQGLFLAAGEVTGGLVASRIDPDSLTVRMKLPTINDGGGFSVTPSPGFPAPDIYYAPLDAFAADAFVEIRGVEVPEPLSALLVVSLGLVCVSITRRPARR